jgi:pimeloyl-ACP methyl ester carboxylesterase
MIGQWLGANAPERLTRLVLANTTARVEHPPAMQERRVAVLERGMTAIAETVLGRFFSPRFLQSGDPAIDWARRTLVASDPVGYAGACAAIRDMDLRTDLARIAVPPLVIAGNFDVPMPWEGHGRLLAESIPGARAVRLDGGHLTNLERPQEFAAAVLDWLAH